LSINEGTGTPLARPRGYAILPTRGYSGFGSQNSPLGQAYRKKVENVQSVLVTGTSTGIGQATAIVLASRGWRVFATMRNLEKAGSLEQALKDAGLKIRSSSSSSMSRVEPPSKRL